MNKNRKYKCLRCGGTTIYLSVTPIDPRGTLTCHTCGETEDARMGIALKNGAKIEQYYIDKTIFRGKKDGVSA